MLKGIKNILKTVGEALAFADVGEMLVDEQKTEVLARHKGPSPIEPNALPPRVVLAGDEEFAPETVERAIALCREHNAILDLLCISPEGSSSSINLAALLKYLGSEPELDFQVTRRYGDLLIVAKDYIRTREDTLMILISVSKSLGKRAVNYSRMDQWAREAKYPEVKLMMMM